MAKQILRQKYTYNGLLTFQTVGSPKWATMLLGGILDLAICLMVVGIIFEITKSALS
jgi:hypothetical protein